MAASADKYRQPDEPQGESQNSPTPLPSFVGCDAMDDSDNKIEAMELGNVSTASLPPLPPSLSNNGSQREGQPSSSAQSEVLLSAMKTLLKRPVTAIVKEKADAMSNVCDVSTTVFDALSPRGGHAPFPPMQIAKKAAVQLLPSTTATMRDAVDAVMVMPPSALREYALEATRAIASYLCELGTSTGDGTPPLNGSHLGNSAIGAKKPPSGPPLEDSAILTDQLQREELHGFKMVNQYMVLKELGRGQSGKVKLAADTQANDRLVAIKIIQRNKVRDQYVESNATPLPRGKDGARRQRRQSDSSLSMAMLREVAIMKKLRHPNIVRLLEVIDDPGASKLYLVMQNVSRGPLLHFTPRGKCEPIEMAVARNYVKQLCSALHYLQRRKIVHRDIKPENILLGENGRVYLSDFGVSGWWNDDRGNDAKNAGAGTAAFMAPEVLRREENYDGHAADIWSLGITFYAMVFGELPYFGKTRDEISEAIDNNELSYAVNGDWDADPDSTTNSTDSDMNQSTDELDRTGAFFGTQSAVTSEEIVRDQQFRDLVGQMLMKKPQDRITLRQMASHAYFMPVEPTKAEDGGQPEVPMFPGEGIDNSSALALKKLSRVKPHLSLSESPTRTPTRTSNASHTVENGAGI